YRGVDRKAHVEADIPQFLPITERCQYYVLGQSGDGVRVSARQETGWRQNAMFRVPASNHPFSTGKLAGDEVELGLIPKLQPTLLHGLFKANRRRRFRGDRPLRP